MSDQTIESAGTKSHLPEFDIVAMAKLFYSKPMIPIAAILWLFAVVMLIVIIACAIGLSGATTTRGQIGYAVGILLAGNGLVAMKAVGWIALTNANLARRLDRIEQLLAKGKA